MTLTDIIPSLRRTLPDPLGINHWPAHTHATITDLVAAGVSMSRLVEICGTPCVHTGDAVVGGTNGRPSLKESATIVGTTVIAVSTAAGEPRTVVIDACLDSLAAVWDEVRLIGRASTAHRQPTRVLSRLTMTSMAVASLPADIAAGDLLVVPCRGLVTLHDLRWSPEGRRSQAVASTPSQRLRRPA